MVDQLNLAMKLAVATENELGELNEDEVHATSQCKQPFKRDHGSIDAFEDVIEAASYIS